MCEERREFIGGLTKPSTFTIGNLITALLSCYELLGSLDTKSLLTIFRECNTCYYFLFLWTDGTSFVFLCLVAWNSAIVFDVTLLSKPMLIFANFIECVLIGASELPLFITSTLKLTEICSMNAK